MYGSKMAGRNFLAGGSFLQGKNWIELSSRSVRAGASWLIDADKVLVDLPELAIEIVHATKMQSIWRRWRAARPWPAVLVAAGHGAAAAGAGSGRRANERLVGKHPFAFLVIVLVDITACKSLI